MIGHGEFNDDAVRAATRDDDVRDRASRDRRAARRARSQRATGSRGIVGHGGGRTWFRHSTLVRSISSRRSASAAPMVSAGRATGSDEGVGRCARESGACGGNLDGSVEPAASARVLNSARRQLSFTPRVAAPRAARQDAETRARVRLFHLRSLPSLRGWRDLRRVRVRGRARVVPVPRAADVAPPSDRRSVSPPLFCRSHQPPTPGSAPLPSAFPSEILPQFLYPVARPQHKGGGASGARHHPHAELRAHLSGAAQNPVHHTYRERGRRRTPRRLRRLRLLLNLCPDPQEVPLDECVAFLEGVAREGRRVLVWDMSGSSKAPSARHRLPDAFARVETRGGVQMGEESTRSSEPPPGRRRAAHQVRSRRLRTHCEHLPRHERLRGAARVDGAVGGVPSPPRERATGEGGAGEFAFAGGRAEGSHSVSPWTARLSCSAAEAEGDRTAGDGGSEDAGKMTRTERARARVRTCRGRAEGLSSGALDEYG